jgi:hypothetical protein
MTSVEDVINTNVIDDNIGYTPPPPPAVGSPDDTRGGA